MLLRPSQLFFGQLHNRWKQRTELVGIIASDTAVPFNNSNGCVYSCLFPPGLSLTHLCGWLKDQQPQSTARDMSVCLVSVFVTHWFMICWERSSHQSNLHVTTCVRGFQAFCCECLTEIHTWLPRVTLLRRKRWDVEPMALVPLSNCQIDELMSVDIIVP